MKKSRNITISSILIAISFVFLYISSILPSAKLASLLIATSCICVIIIECGKWRGFISGIVLSILSWFFVPDKTISILFIMFFSYYPLIKLFAEQKKRITEWIIKIVYFFVITLAGFLVLKLTGLVSVSLLSAFDDAILVGVGVMLLVLIECIFDYALSMVIGFYMRRIKGNF